MTTGQIRITAGCHAGAVVTLGQAPISIGTDPTCDVVLHEDGLEPVHFVLQGALEGTFVTAKGGSVCIDGETDIAPGFRAIVSGDMDLTIGPVRMEVTPALPVVVPSRWKMPQAAPLLSVALCAVLLVGAQAFAIASAPGLVPPIDVSAEDGPRSVETRSHNTMSIDQVAATQGLAADPAGKPFAPLTITDAIDAHLIKLELHGLNVQGSAGTIMLSGVVPPASRAAWDAFQRWFDIRWPGVVLQADDIVLASADLADPDFPAIQSVWSMGETPYVMIGGSRVRVGNAIDGNWTLQAINATSVTLRKDGRDWQLNLIDGQEVAGLSENVLAGASE